jgi:putative PIN family toxin of toxin-antitoxin system
MLRIVLDTNILISAIIHDGKPRKLFQMGINGKYQLLISKGILDELSGVLQRPKFKMTKEDVIQIISALITIGDNVWITSNFKVVINDPDDDIIINTAHDGKADYIVSGDCDMQNIANFHGIKIVSVNEMLKILD